MRLNNASLTTISRLSRLIDFDKNDHALKSITQLFLNAATDWPTRDLIEISAFVKELKEYFGEPLTKEKISAKILNVPVSNAWLQITGSSIIEMLELSEKFFDQSGFDKAVQDILSYYEKLLQDVDFVAELKYLTSIEGGRTTPAFSGYRPYVKFEFTELQTSGQQTFLDKEVVYPGERVEAAIRIAPTEHFTNSLTRGMVFEFREGNWLIGTGIITDILNDKLVKATA